MAHKAVSNGTRARHCFTVLLRQVQKSIDAWRRFIFLGPAHPDILPSGARFWDLSMICDARQHLLVGRYEPHLPSLRQVFFGCTYIAPWDSDPLSPIAVDLVQSQLSAGASTRKSHSRTARAVICGVTSEPALSHRCFSCVANSLHMLPRSVSQKFLLSLSNPT
jgi:hypothetical protein